MGELWADLRYGVRMLVRTPVVSLVAALSLALGIAGTASVLAMANSFFRGGFSWQEPDRLALIWEENLSRDVTQAPASPANFLDWDEQATSFTGLAAYTLGPAGLTGGDRPPEQIRAITATPDLLDVLGAQPVLGRGFRPEEGVPGSGDVVVLLHDLWQGRFLGDREILGRTIEVDGVPHTVVGVMGPEFEMIPANVHLLRPSDFTEARDDRDGRSLFVVARLGPGVTIETAEAEMAALGERLAAEHPEANRDWRARPELLKSFFPGPTDTRLIQILLVVSLFGLLIACANVANLLLGRAEERQKEVGLRTALGAGRGRILRQLLTESLVLATVAGVLGVAGAWWIVEALGTAMPPELPAAFYPRLAPEVLLVSVGVVLATGLAFGLAPALHAVRGEIRDVLGESRGGTASRSRKRLRKAFVVGEFAAALALLTGAVLLTRAFERLAGDDTGFDAAGVLTFEAALPEIRYPSDDDVRRYWDEALTALEALPEVEAASAMVSLPRGRNTPGTTVDLASRPETDEARRPRVRYLTVGGDWLETLDVELVSGRFLNDGDRAEALPVAVVNEAFVRAHFPDASPLGERIRLGAEEEDGEGAYREIVGVIADVAQDRLSIEGDAPVTVLVPVAQAPRRALAVAVRARNGDPAALAPAVRLAMAAVDPDIPLGRVMTLEAHVAEMLGGPRAISLFLAAAGVITLLLAAMGIYGVMAHTVVQQTREIGIRMAVGAERGRVVGMVARSGVSLAAVGLLVGTPLAFLMSLAVDRALTGITAVASPLASGLVVAGTLALVAVLACVVPALRAAGIQPVRALQGE